MKNNPIIITGIHRSGTSLLSKFLQNENVYFGNSNTRGNITTIIILAPETEYLFAYDGIFEILDIEVANSKELIKDVTLPFSTSLHAAYPNPFNPATKIRYDMSVGGDVKLSIYNLSVFKTFV